MKTKLIGGIVKGIGSLIVKKDKSGGALKAIPGSGIVDAIKVLKSDPKNINNWIGFASYALSVIALLFLIYKGLVSVSPEEIIKLLF